MSEWLAVSLLLSNTTTETMKQQVIHLLFGEFGPLVDAFHHYLNVLQSEKNDFKARCTTSSISAREFHEFYLNNSSSFTANSKYTHTQNNARMNGFFNIILLNLDIPWVWFAFFSQSSVSLRLFRIGKLLWEYIYYVCLCVR